MALSAATAGEFDLAAVGDDFSVDPYPAYGILRQYAPLCRQPDGSYVLTRYDDVKRALAEADTFSSDKRLDFKPRFGDSPLFEHHTTSIVFNDPPYHTRVRRLLAPFFAARVLRQMEHSIGTMVDTLLDRGADSGGMDIVSEFAQVIPLNLIGDLLGVPHGEREPLLGWAKSILSALEPSRTPAELEQGNRAVVDFKAYLADLIRHKRANPPRDGAMDVLWALIESSDDGDGLSELEILHNAIFMLNAGHDTTASLIANGVDLLLRYPQQRRRLIDDPTLIKSAIEEMLRFESPLQFGNRRATRDTAIAGVDLPAGTFLHLIIAAANRDERQFPAADTFDIARRPNKHLAFGHGIHTCAGNSVARIEAVIAFGKLLERFPDFEPAGPVIRSPRLRFRIIDHLPIRVM